MHSIRPALRPPPSPKTSPFPTRRPRPAPRPTLRPSLPRNRPRIPARWGAHHWERTPLHWESTSLPRTRTRTTTHTYTTTHTTTHTRTRALRGRRGHWQPRPPAGPPSPGPRHRSVRGLRIQSRLGAAMEEEANAVIVIVNVTRRAC